MGVNVTFPPGKLGLKVMLSKDWGNDRAGPAAMYAVAVEGFNVLEDGKPSPAMKAGGVREDDLIVSVAGRTTEGENYDTVVQWIQSSPRPMNITFCAPEQLLSLVAEDLIRGVDSRDSGAQLPVRLL